MTKIRSECFTLHNELRVLYMTKLTVSLTILLLAVFSSIALVGTPPVFSTTEDSGSESESEDSSEEETQEEESEPETEPEDTPPAQTDEPPVPAGPLPEAAIVPESEPEVIECKEGYVLDNDKCVPDPLTELGELVGPPSECPPELGLTPLECLDEVVNPPTSQQREALPYCDTPEAEGRSCHDLQDYDEETGLYPCNDGTQEENAEDCPDAYESPLDPNENQTDPSPPVPSPSPEVEVDVGDNTTDPGDNQTDPNPLPPQDNDTNGNGTNGDIDIDIIIKNINKNVFVNEKSHHHESFPEIDIIGLSTKDNGDSNVCLINIDKEHVQCQEFGMASDRVNGDFWRVIETDHDKDYDNGNTGSNDINGVIEDIKSQDFSELDDATNHDFDIDLAWIAINPQGDGAVCLSEDSTGKGKSLCEPFKVSSQEISGQITEGVAIKNT